MGLWGFRLFESESQLDSVYAIEEEVGYDLYEYDPTKVLQAREKLDAGLGAELLAKARDIEATRRYPWILVESPAFGTMVVAAYLMGFGARISEDNLQYIKRVALRAALHKEARVQIVCAMDKYRAGEPRSFCAPSCFNCGKMAYDLDGKKLSECSACKVSVPAWYCDRECQKADWKTHKKTFCAGRSTGMI